MLYSRRFAPTLLVYLLALGLLVLSFLLAISLGAANIPLDEVWRLLFYPEGSNNALIVHTLRLPRAIVAALVGACLGVAGAMMQGITRNPLSEPGIMGVNAGAVLAILVALVFSPTFLHGAPWWWPL